MGDHADDMMFREIGLPDTSFFKKEKILPCKKCGHTPIKYKINTGTVRINPHGKEAISFDRIEEHYACFNPMCGADENKSVREWNKAQ